VLRTPSISTAQAPQFAEPAAVFRTVQFEIVAQHVKQRGIGVSVDIVDLPLTVGGSWAASCCWFPPLVALQNIAINPCEDTVCIQTCKPGSPSEAAARFVNRTPGQLNFYSAAAFSLPNTLDSFSARAQHRLYTNKMPGGERYDIKGRLNLRRYQLAYPTV